MTIFCVTSSADLSAGGLVRDLEFLPPARDMPLSYIRLSKSVPQTGPQ